MNTSYSEHFVDSPVGVHYREVLLYYDRISMAFMVFFEYACWFITSIDADNVKKKKKKKQKKKG